MPGMKVFNDIHLFFVPEQYGLMTVWATPTRRGPALFNMASTFQKALATTASEN